MLCTRDLRSSPLYLTTLSLCADLGSAAASTRRLPCEFDSDVRS